MKKLAAREGFKFSRESDPFLIAHGGAFVGSRHFEGGRFFAWGDPPVEYPWSQVWILIDGTIYARLMVDGDPAMCTSRDVPFPFDRFTAPGSYIPKDKSWPAM